MGFVQSRLYETHLTSQNCFVTTGCRDWSYVTLFYAGLLALDLGLTRPLHEYGQTAQMGRAATISGSLNA